MNFQGINLRTLISDSFILMNCDVCSLHPLKSLIDVHNEAGKMATVLCVKSEIESSTGYGCIYIRDDQSQEKLEKIRNWKSQIGKPKLNYPI